MCENKLNFFILVRITSRFQERERKEKKKKRKRIGFISVKGSNSPLIKGIAPWYLIVFEDFKGDGILYSTLRACHLHKFSFCMNCLLFCFHCCCCCFFALLFIAFWLFVYPVTTLIYLYFISLFVLNMYVFT